MKPHIICHIMSSVDGRLIDSRWTPSFNGTAKNTLLKVYSSIGTELHTDAWMFGLNTAKESLLPYKFVAKKTEHNMSQTAYVAPRTTPRLFILSDPDGTVFYHTNTVRGCNIATILSRHVSDEYLQHLQSTGVSYLFGGDNGYDLPAAMAILSESFGITRISLQGGGIINGTMLEAGLIDELSLVVYPGIDGLAGVPSIFEYVGSQTDRPAANQSLEFIGAEQRDYGVMWLRYRFHRTKASRQK